MGGGNPIPSSTPAQRKPLRRVSGYGTDWLVVVLKGKRSRNILSGTEVGWACPVPSMGVVREALNHPGQVASSGGSPYAILVSPILLPHSYLFPVLFPLSFPSRALQNTLEHLAVRPLSIAPLKGAVQQAQNLNASAMESTRYVLELMSLVLAYARQCSLIHSCRFREPGHEHRILTRDVASVTNAIFTFAIGDMDRPLQSSKVPIAPGLPRPHRALPGQSPAP